MDVTDHQQKAREAQRMQANREELVERIGRAIRVQMELPSLSQDCTYTATPSR